MVTTGNEVMQFCTTNVNYPEMRFQDMAEEPTKKESPIGLLVFIVGLAILP